MTNLHERIHKLNDLIVRGDWLEAFNKYYHTDVVMQENEQNPTVGKTANLEREKEFYSAVIDFRKATPMKVAVGENNTMVEWHFDYTHKDWGVRNYKQISVQEWKDGLIIKENFYYGS